MRRVLSARGGMLLASALVTVTLLLLVGLISLALQRLEYQRERELVGERLKGLQGTLIREMPSALAIGEVMGSFIIEENTLSDSLFQKLAQHFVEAQPLIQGVVLIRGTTVARVYPETFASLLGRDLSGQLERSAALKVSRALRSSITIGPLPALTRAGQSLNTFVPLFVDPRRSGTADGYWGTVVVVMDPAPLLQRLQQLAAAEDIELAARTRPVPGGTETLLFGDPGLFVRAHVGSWFPLPGSGEWELGAEPREGWRKWSTPARWFVALGVLMSLGSGVLVHLTLRSRTRIRFMAFHDALTRLPNRRMFQERLREALAQARAHGTPGALLLVDLDGFKRVNDAHGHPVGDHVLRVLSSRMLQIAGAPHLVARTGGDEFAVLLHGVEQRQQAADTAERLILALSQPIQLPLSTDRLGASIGIALFPADGTDAADLLMRTDQALYQVKKSGRNGYAWVGDPVTQRGDRQAQE